jgi:hypothetical protein
VSKRRTEDEDIEDADAWWTDDLLVDLRAAEKHRGEDPYSYELFRLSAATAIALVRTDCWCAQCDRLAGRRTIESS